MLAYFIMPLLIVGQNMQPSQSASIADSLAELFHLALPVQPLTLDVNVKDKDGFMIDRIGWTDVFGKRRQVTMVHNDGQDPAGYYGGYLRSYTLQTPDGPRICTGSSAYHPGFGYTVNHYDGGVNSSRRYKGDTWRYLLRGRHHLILEQSWHYPLGDGEVRATVQWFFATGRSHPIYAVTFDSSAAGPNTLNADSRAPYGDIGWDGDAGLPVDGIAWGDRYLFGTLKGPVTSSTGWSNTAPNTVPFTLAYSNQADAEMGLVQTQTLAQHDAGGYDGYTFWNKEALKGPMPNPSSWPFQLNQWELDHTDASKRMAWGLGYGSVGQTEYAANGNDRTCVGYPYQSYSTYVVVGVHSRREVHDMRTTVETAQTTQFSVSGAGHINTQGPSGIARDDAAPWDLIGYNPIYGSYEATYTGTANQAITMNFNVTATLAQSGVLLVVHNWPDAEPMVHLNGKPFLPDTVTFASLDTKNHTLWLSLIDPLSPGETSISLTPSPSGQKSQG